MRKMINPSPSKRTDEPRADDARVRTPKGATYRLLDAKEELKELEAIIEEGEITQGDAMRARREGAESA
jgi:hypothetical protein